MTSMTPLSSRDQTPPCRRGSGRRRRYARRRGTAVPGPPAANAGARRAAVAPPAATPPRLNRLGALLLHVPYYSIEGASRLAADCAVSRSTVSRLLAGRSRPSFRVAQAVADALARRSGLPVAPRDVFSVDGTFEGSACEKMGCRGCLPPQAWDERRDRLRPEWKNARPGDWSRPGAAQPPEAANPPA